MSYKHLQDESYYSDLYDRFTIEECRRREQHLLTGEEFKTKNGKPAPLEAQKSIKQGIADIALYFITGERYARKSETIREWMEKDRKKDEVLDSASPLPNIHCSYCGHSMESIDKDLYWGTTDDEKDRVLFLYQCVSCRKRRGLFDNGEEFHTKPTTCPKCSRDLERSYKKRGNKVDIIYICPNCKYKEVETMDFSEKPKEAIDQNFLADKKRFCMDEKSGGEYILMAHQFEQLKQHQAEQDERIKHKDLYDKVAKIKKLTLNQLEKLLAGVLEKEKYLKFTFVAPDMNARDLFISFTVQEADVSRNDYDSKQNLKKIIDKTLSNINWRLMSDGISSRLGILYGRIRGYEREEDLLKLVSKT